MPSGQSRQWRALPRDLVGEQARRCDRAEWSEDRPATHPNEDEPVSRSKVKRLRSALEAKDAKVAQLEQAVLALQRDRESRR